MWLRANANIYLLKHIIDTAIENDDTITLFANRKKSKGWQNNHELLIRNYELMKMSRKKIIKQRDQLQKQVDYYKQREEEAQPLLDCKREVQRLLHILTLKNGEEFKLKRENEKLRRTMNYQIETIKNLEHIINQKEG